VSRACIMALRGGFWAALLCCGVRVDGAGCSRCGCAGDWKQTCRAVSEEAEVEVTCWGVKCEDFCVPGPSCRGCKHTQCVCEPKPADATAAQDARVRCAGQLFSWSEWFPQCAEIFTRKKLLKRTEKVKITRHKWVVETLCPACRAAPPAASPPQTAAAAK
jgi:hypothetical protein